MKNTKNILFVNKNSQRGASVLEVIFAIGLVVAVTPFMYNQISEMTHVIHDVSVANKITSTRDAVLSFMRVNQPEFIDESNEITADDLNTIAPEAVKGIVYQVSVGNSAIKNLETYLLFNIDDSKYRVSSIAKYIGGDAAVVGDDNRAYAKDWAVQLPDSWSDVLASGDNHLVYRITRDFGGDDKTLYLHRSNLGEADHLNQMRRDLLMNNYSMVNVGNFNATRLNLQTVISPLIKTPNNGQIVAEIIQFTKGADIDGDLTINDLKGMNVYGFETVNVDNLCSQSPCNLSTITLNSSNFFLNNDLKAVGDDVDVNVNGFTLTGDLRAVNIFVDNIYTPDITGGTIFFISNEMSVSNVYALQLGTEEAYKWIYINSAPGAGRTDHLPDGPKLKEINIDSAVASDVSLNNHQKLHPFVPDSQSLSKILNNGYMQ